jgi:hypothetical protein
MEMNRFYRKIYDTRPEILLIIFFVFSGYDATNPRCHSSSINFLQCLPIFPSTI